MEIQGWALMILILQCYTRSGYLQSSSLFQCQSSSDQSGLVYTPNIPDKFFNRVNVAALWISGHTFKKLPTTVLEERVTHISTIPASRNCSGSLVSIQYCYRAKDEEINIEQVIFILSSLVSLNQQGLFEVISTTPIRTTPRDSKCTETDPPKRICCDTTPLSGLQITSSEYVFSVTQTNPRLLMFKNNITEYDVRRTSAALGNTGPPQGSRFTLNESNSRSYTSRSILLRFIIGPSSITEDASSITEDASSITEDASSITEDASSITEDAFSITKDASSITEDASSITEDVSSITEDASSITEDASSITEDASSITEDASSFTEDASIPPHPNSNSSLVNTLTGISITLALLLLVITVTAILAGIFTLRRRAKRNLNTRENLRTGNSMDTVTTSHINTNTNQAYGTTTPPDIVEAEDHIYI